MKRKQIIELLFLAILCGGCSLSFTPPPISDENQHFENTYFAIDYPKGWKTNEIFNNSFDLKEKGSQNAFATFISGADRKDINTVVIFDPRYPKYSINIGTNLVATDPFDSSSDREKLQEISNSADIGTKSILNNFGYLRRGYSTRDLSLNGIPSILIKYSGQNASGEIYVFHSLQLISKGRRWTITYGFMENAEEKNKRRIEDIVNSFRIK